MSNPTQCAILTDYDIGRGGGNCPRAPTVRAVWRFGQLGAMRILLCNEHAAELAENERLILLS